MSEEELMERQFSFSPLTFLEIPPEEKALDFYLLQAL